MASLMQQHLLQLQRDKRALQQLAQRHGWSPPLRHRLVQLIEEGHPEYPVLPQDARPADGEEQALMRYARAHSWGPAHQRLFLYAVRKGPRRGLPLLERDLHSTAAANAGEDVVSPVIHLYQQPGSVRLVKVGSAIDRATTDQMRAFAEDLIARDKEAFEEAAKQGYSVLSLPTLYAEVRRYAPFADKIKEAEEMFADGEKQHTDRGRRLSYRSAFRLAEEAALGIAEEAKWGPFYEKYTTLAWAWLKKEGSELVGALKKEGKKLAENAATGFGAAAALLLALSLLSKGGRPAPPPPPEAR